MHLRIDNHETVRELIALLLESSTTIPRPSSSSSNNNHHLRVTTCGNDERKEEKEHPLFTCESLQLSIVDSLFQPSNNNHNYAATQQHHQQEQFVQLCRVLADALPNLRKIQLGRALSGFIHAGLGAWCPLEGIAVLLGEAKHLESIMLTNLQVYSMTTNHRSGEGEEEEEGEEDPAVVSLLAQSLRDHPTLQQFGWQNCVFIPSTPAGTTIPTLDPMLQSLSTIRDLKKLIIQSPPALAVARRVPRIGEPVLQNLIGSKLQALHLEGVHLQDNHIKSLLGSTSSRHRHQLKSISLSLKLTLENTHTIALCLADFLRNTTSQHELQYLSLHLDGLKDDDNTHDGNNENDNNNDRNTPIQFNRRRRKQGQRLQALRYFESTIAHAIIVAGTGGDGHQQQQPQGGLQRLELIYYNNDSSCCSYNGLGGTEKNNDDKDDKKKKKKCAANNPFVKVMETNYSLIHLRLPFCGELDPSIHFLLKLNRTGLRQCLLAARGRKATPNRRDCLQALFPLIRPLPLKEQQQQQHPTSGNQECYDKLDPNMRLSMLFYLLTEMPTLFL